MLARISRNLTLIGGLAILAGCRAAPAERWTVKFSHVYSANTDYQRMALRFRELMLEHTGGRFQVVIYPSGQLGDERVAFEQLDLGVPVEDIRKLVKTNPERLLGLS
jgi:TRAP-type C4-dicarboxylate transport system substrate-binding protein